MIESTKNGLKGQQAISPGQRPGEAAHTKFALKGQKHLYFNAFALTGRGWADAISQGAALG
ncbi:MAG: hypothetical protein J6M53_00675 [Bacteroidaceae bacterium]|nr:hypothetical protein [Bacteroidaceae bacterium]